MSEDTVHIVRTKSEDGNDVATVYDSDGECLCIFPGSMTDDDVLACLDISDQAYSLGFQEGYTMATDQEVMAQNVISFIQSLTPDQLIELLQKAEQKTDSSIN